jgi:Xaa-Pro aminopeptidase
MNVRPVLPELFSTHRQRLIERLPAGALVVLVSNDEMPRAGDAVFRFHQNPDLYYCCGIDQEQTTLILFPDAPDPQHREMLFLRRTNDHIKVWEGHKYTKEEGQATSGIREIRWADELDNFLPMLVNRANSVWLGANENDRASNPVEDRQARFARELRERFPLQEFCRAAPILRDLRMVKDEAEIGLIREACRITRDGFQRILRMIRPGVGEWEIEAELAHEFLRQKASGFAYEPIIAAGADSNILHYNANNKVCQDGDLLLMDFGAAYANYNADLTRTVPVNGRFTERQRAVYDAVLRVMRRAYGLLRPGTLLHEYHKEVGRIMESELIGLGLLDKDKVAQQNPKAPLYKRYFMHGTSHHLGLDVHDIGDRYGAIQAGNVFTVEPGIYIPEEGFGIRLENDVVVTDGEPRDLMDDIPIEAEAIETAMQEALQQA